jgi:AAA15 family ATPase/GTPase
MNDEHFIKNIEIKNFKLFKDFKAEGFGRVNLIGGKNNVGKTAFMEACYLSSDKTTNESMDFINPFLVVEASRRVISKYNGLMPVSTIIKTFEKYQNLELKTNNFNIFLEIKKNSLNEEFLVNGKNMRVSRQLNNEIVENRNTTQNNFISSCTVNDDLINSIFDVIKLQRKREQLNKILKEFDNNIVEFEIIHNVPKFFLNNIQSFQDATESGYGTNRFIMMIGSILINKNGFLFLDEIENGIHYTKLDRLWEIILRVSKEQSVQVFATTHSKECIESYARVAKRLEDYDVKYIKLSKLKDGSIYAGVRDYDMLQYVIDDEHEVR